MNRLLALEAAEFAAWLRDKVSKGFMATLSDSKPLFAGEAGFSRVHNFSEFELSFWPKTSHLFAVHCTLCGYRDSGLLY